MTSESAALILETASVDMSQLNVAVIICIPQSSQNVSKRLNKTFSFTPRPQRRKAYLLPDYIELYVCHQWPPWSTVSALDVKQGSSQYFQAHVVDAQS